MYTRDVAKALDATAFSPRLPCAHPVIRASGLALTRLADPACRVEKGAGMATVARAARTLDLEPTPLNGLFLARIACNGGATRQDILRDLADVCAHKLSPAEWRREVELGLAAILDAGLASESRNRLTATAAGVVTAAKFLQRPDTDKLPNWADQRDISLIAKGLGLDGQTPARLRVLLRPEGLRAFIVQTSFGLTARKNPSLSKLRAQLALVALQRAFGNKVKTEIGRSSSLSAKAGRLLAGQLSRSPRDFGTDARLIAELAAEQVGALQTDADALRAAILKSLGSKLLSQHRVASPTSRPVPTPANDLLPATAGHPSPRPGLADFARRVQAAARVGAEGWPGNRKAFISKVWDTIRASESAWALSEIEFKCMLAEAHRAGALVLANADLRDKKDMAELTRSATAYKNTVWHFVRVED